MGEMYGPVYAKTGLNRTSLQTISKVGKFENAALSYFVQMPKMDPFSGNDNVVALHPPCNMP